MHPMVSLFSYLFKAFKQIGIEHSSSIGAIKPFHIGVLHRSARLYVE